MGCFDTELPATGWMWEWISHQSGGIWLAS